MILFVICHFNYSFHRTIKIISRNV